MLCFAVDWLCVHESSYQKIAEGRRFCQKLLKYLSARITAYFSDLHKSAARDTADLEKKADRNRNDIKVTHDWLSHAEKALKRYRKGALFISFSKVLDYLISPHAVLRGYAVLVSLCGILH